MNNCRQDQPILTHLVSHWQSALVTISGPMVKVTISASAVIAEQFNGEKITLRDLPDSLVNSVALLQSLSLQL